MESATKQGMGLHSLTPKPQSSPLAVTSSSRRSSQLMLRDMAFVLDRCHWDWAVELSTLSLPTLIHETIGLQIWVSWHSLLMELSKALRKAKHHPESLGKQRLLKNRNKDSCRSTNLFLCIATSPVSPHFNSYPHSCTQPQGFIIPPPPSAQAQNILLYFTHSSSCDGEM